MLASVEHGFVLLSNRKCGSTALERAYRPHAEFKVFGTPRWKHLGYRTFKEVFGDFFERNGCEVFVVAREPLDLLMSWYRYRAREALRGEPQFTGDIPFGTFFAEWSLDSPPPRAAVEDQSAFLLDAGGALPPVRYYRHGDIPALVRRLNALIGREVEVPAANVSPAMQIGFDRALAARSAKFAREAAVWERIPFVAA